MLSDFIFHVSLSSRNIFNEIGQDGFHKIHDSTSGNLYVNGDCIVAPGTNFDLIKNEKYAAQWIVDRLKGHFYFCYWDKLLNKTIIGNSNFSILPLYYSISNNNLYVTSNIQKMADLD